MENGPGAGPWHRAEGKEDLSLLFLEFAASFGDTFHQNGHCIYADYRVAISLIHETRTAPSGDPFDNLAVYVGRLRPGPFRFSAGQRDLCRGGIPKVSQ
jgi:hypothetical protein